MTQHNLRNSPIQMGLSTAHVPAGSAAVSTDDVTTPGNYQSVSDLDTALLAKGGIYTQVYLDSLTFNDKVYALKLLDDTTNYPQV